MSLEAHFLSHSKSKSELESELSHLGSKIECWLPTTQGSGHGVKCLAVLKARYICLFMKKSSLSASLDSTLRLCFLSFFFFFFLQRQWLIRSSVNSALMHCSRTPQTPLFINFFIKNGSHSTIHIFKNYFTTVFSVFSFQFQQNKFYPNRPSLNFRLV